MEITFCGEIIREEDINSMPWLKYILYTRENQVNIERVTKISEINSKNHVLEYVERTLLILDTHTDISDEAKDYVRTTLQWAEVAKCGMPEQRKKWQDAGLNLHVHNEASAEIYRMEADCPSQDAICDNSQLTKKKEIVATLINTHGLLGQYLRGEADFLVNKQLEKLIEDELISRSTLKEVLFTLNHAIIGAVSDELWNNIREEIGRLIDCICNLNVDKEKRTVLQRLKCLFAAYRHVDEISKKEEELFENIFDKCDIWYAESALGTFSRNEINTIFEMLADIPDGVKHVSFYNLSRNLNYDYEGHRKVNVYKKRIIELCLKEYALNESDAKSDEHVKASKEVVGDTLHFDMKFTRVCDSLVNFCVEAERSGIMTYEKSIQTIFDLFGFRRDIFDRLNNEDKYLDTMNDANASTKLQIMNYITGDSIVDVGSGGGVLLDVLEKNYPDKRIIGTDISFNVIEKLENKIKEENHNYTVRRHNFVEGALEEKVDTVLFSSILHEVYSYTEWKGERFNIDAVKNALKNACDSLAENGRIVIRDGIMSDSIKVGRVRFTTPEGVAFAKNYIRDFKGLKQLRNGDEWQADKVSLDGDVLTADVNFIREALYTYTWGTESYAQEVMEQFGYFTHKDYLESLSEIGMEIIHSEVFTEPGYPENLNPLVELLDGLTWEELPSTIIVAAQKK